MHGNSAASMKPQHGYVIYRQDAKGDVEAVKTGISGQPLNKDGSSPRANRQVNAFNREDDGFEYYAEVVETGIPGRKEALKWEQQSVNELDAQGYELVKHARPKPERND